jgi:toxin-antitoxin system PIN domain toxin
MSVALLDVNVLVALFDPNHIHHEVAHDWFGRNRRRGWATCPITINGCIRVLSNPAYPSFEATTGDVIAHLREFLETPGHHFWPDAVSLVEQRLFRANKIRGHRAITDTYLLGLAVENGGVLATFDQSISIEAVAGANRGHLAVISSVRR